LPSSHPILPWDIIQTRLKNRTLQKTKPL
jgi:hypothetical protein